MIGRTAICLALLSATTVQASPFCDSLFAQPEQSQIILPGTQSAGICARSLTLSGGSQIHCRWPFEYRAPSAVNAFEALSTAVATCLNIAPIADQPVNHPDFYELRTYRVDGQDIGVSLKDKAALQQTYVFLRISL